MNGLSVDCGLRDGDYRAVFVGPSNFALRFMRVRDGVVFFRGKSILIFPGRWVLSPIQNFAGLLKEYQVRNLYDFDGVCDDKVFIFPFDLDTLNKYVGLLPVDKIVELDSVRLERDMSFSRSADLKRDLTDLSNTDLLHKRMASDLKFVKSLLGNGPQNNDSVDPKKK